MRTRAQFHAYYLGQYPKSTRNSGPLRVCKGEFYIALRLPVPGTPLLDHKTRYSLIADGHGSGGRYRGRCFALSYVSYSYRVPSVRLAARPVSPVPNDTRSPCHVRSYTSPRQSKSGPKLGVQSTSPPSESRRIRTSGCLLSDQPHLTGFDR